MIQGYSRGRFEYFVVATVIALIALIALDRYTLMISEARILRLEIISHHFMTAAANVRTEYLVSRIQGAEHFIPGGIPVGDKIIHVTEQGWPASVMPLADDFKPSDGDCYQLWQLLLLNPAPVSVGQQVSGTNKYLAFAQADHCRYMMADGEAYFDYFPVSGRLLFSAINN